jgi:hypothetical protein
MKSWCLLSGEEIDAETLDLLPEDFSGKQRTDKGRYEDLEEVAS